MGFMNFKSDNNELKYQIAFLYLIDNNKVICKSLSEIINLMIIVCWRTFKQTE